MRIIKIEAEENGGHFCQEINSLSKLPSGWAIVPEDMELPNLPYGDSTVENKHGVPTVTSWTQGEIPPIPDIEREPTSDELIDILLGVDANE